MASCKYGAECGLEADCDVCQCCNEVHPCECPQDEDLEGFDSGWLCGCGAYNEHDFHCDFCGAEPPWGCPCDGHDESDDECGELLPELFR